MPKKYYPVAAWIVVFLFDSTAHACPGVASLNLAIRNLTTVDAANERPCRNEEKNVCQSVRDSILSLKPSLANPQQAVPQLHRTETPVPFVSALVTPIVAVYPVFKSELGVSSVVRRV